MTIPTLLLCVGATKAGTSWLHRFVASHPQCHLRGVKELHYFDAVESQDFAPWIADVEAARRATLDGLVDVSDRHLDKRAQVVQDAGDWLKVLRAEQSDDAAYLDYLTEGAGNARLVGDFTPAYSLLDEAALDRMASVAPDVRFIYLLRDPAARLWSHIRMLAARQSQDAAGLAQRAGALLRKVLHGRDDGIALRSDYVGPLQRMRRAINPVQMLVVFYEELFSDATIARICSFLGLDTAPANFAQPVMAGPDLAAKPRQWMKMKEFLAPQYDAMAGMFETLPEAWGKEPMKV